MVQLKQFHFSQLGLKTFIDGYEIFEDGNIFINGKEVRKSKNSQGYYVVQLKTPEKNRHTCYIHHLIYYYFIDKNYFIERKYHLQIDHINQERLDNRKCNLRAITKMENLKNRRKPIRKKKTLEEVFNTRYNEEQKRLLYEMLKKEFEC